MPAIDPAQLAAEIRTDPQALGYAAPLAAGQDGVIADLLNAVNPAYVVSLSIIDKGDFLIGMLPAASALAGQDAATQANWDRMISIACANNTIDVGNAAVQAVLTAAVQQNLLSQAQADAVTKRAGSRAEVLFGAGTVVTHTDVARALGNLGKIVPPPPAQQGGN